MNMCLCPICGFAGLKEPLEPDPQQWRTFEICPCCGWEFGYDNPNRMADYRIQWIEGGGQWFSPDKRPQNWNMTQQLLNIGVNVVM